MLRLGQKGVIKIFQEEAANGDVLRVVFGNDDWLQSAEDQVKELRVKADLGYFWVFRADVGVADHSC
jgi:hypothetical protein